MQDRKSNYLRVFVIMICRKLEPDLCYPRCYITEPDIGLRFVREDAPPR